MDETEGRRALTQSEITDLQVAATNKLMEALASSEARMRRRIDSLSEIVFELNSSRQLVFLNSAWKLILGLDLPPCIGRPLVDFVVEESRPRLDSLLSSINDQTSQAKDLFRFKTTGNEFRWMQLTTLTPTQDGFIGALKDVTHERETKEKLEQMSLVAANTNNLVLITDADGRIEWLNNAFSMHTGYTLPEVIGKIPGHLLQGVNTDPDEVARIGKAVRAGTSVTAELINYTKTGLEYWTTIHISPVKNEHGAVSRFISIQSDTTRLRNMQIALERSKDAAEAASQAKSDFLANMSHEIRTPMNGVIGMTDMALDTPLDPNQREYLSIVKSSAQSLMVILNDILDFSKIEAGKLDIESVDFSIAETVEETLKTIQARAEKKGLTLQSSLAPGLPRHALGDPGRIRQVLTNLCDNAIKFTARGSVTVGVTARSLGTDATELQVSVSDTGIGIPAEKQSGVFEAFQQADTSITRQFGGTGLGLTICVRLVQLMGGRIWLESEPGRGSTFHFTVRVREAVPGLASLPIQSPNRQTSAVQTRSLSVLLVEDHPVNQILATTLLKKWGHSVILANNGQEAVNLFPSQRWDLVLMDMQMPVMGGTEATRLIRAGEPAGQHTLIIAITANAMASDRQECLDAGMDDFLAKPYTIAKLSESLGRWLAGPLKYVDRTRQTSGQQSSNSNV